MNYENLEVDESYFFWNNEAFKLDETIMLCQFSITVETIPQKISH